MLMIRTTISKGEMAEILKQANRELEAEKLGYESHHAQVVAHRKARRQKLLNRRDAVRASALA